ncbi:hypothetical protein CG709_03900, partial [Lachnotalea glycerini]
MDYDGHMQKGKMKEKYGGYAMDKKEFLELFEKNELKLIREALNLMNAVDLASLLAELSDKENVIAFRLIEKKKAAEAFAYMDGEQ